MCVCVSGLLAGRWPLNERSPETGPLGLDLSPRPRTSLYTHVYYTHHLSFSRHSVTRIQREGPLFPIFSIKINHAPRLQLCVVDSAARRVILLPLTFFIGFSHSPTDGRAAGIITAIFSWAPARARGPEIAGEIFFPLRFPAFFLSTARKYQKRISRC